MKFYELENMLDQSSLSSSVLGVLHPHSQPSYICNLYFIFGLAPNITK